jgi:hypothetical protein
VASLAAVAPQTSTAGYVSTRLSLQVVVSHPCDWVPVDHLKPGLRSIYEERQRADVPVVCVSGATYAVKISDPLWFSEKRQTQVSGNAKADLQGSVSTVQGSLLRIEY